MVNDLSNITKIEGPKKNHSPSYGIRHLGSGPEQKEGRTNGPVGDSIKRICFKHSGLNRETIFHTLQRSLI